MAKDRVGPAAPLSVRELAERTAIVLVLGFGAIFVWYSLHVFLLIFLGILLAILFNAAARGLEGVTRMPYRTALIASAVIGVTLTAGFAAVVLPAIGNQFDQLTNALPEAISSLTARLQQHEWGRLLLKLVPEVEHLKSTSALLSHATLVFSGALGAMFSALLVFFTGLYLALEPNLYVRGVLHLVTHHYRERAAVILASVGHTLRWWLVGQIVAMTFVGVSIAIGLALLEVPLALTLGAIAFLLDFIPNFGPILAAIPAVLLGLEISPSKAIYVVVLYIFVQQMEAGVVTPLIQRKTVHLPPVLTLMSQVIFAVLAGSLGLVLAGPLAAALFVLVKMIYVEDVLGEEIQTPDDELPRAKIPRPPPHVPAANE